MKDYNYKPGIFCPMLPWLWSRKITQKYAEYIDRETLKDYNEEVEPFNHTCEIVVLKRKFPWQTDQQILTTD